MEQNKTLRKKTFTIGENGESFLSAVRAAVKLYDRFLEPLRVKYGLSKLELVVVGFLHNNPGKNTVGEIAALRSLSKGNVSCAVDSLCEKGLLIRRPDEKDRRTVHLELQPEALPIVNEIESVSAAYKADLLHGFTEEEKEIYVRLSQRLLENMEENLNYSEAKGE